MSYGFSVTSVPAAEVGDALTKSFEAYKGQLASSDYKLDDSADEQARAGIVAAKALVDSGFVGTGLVNASVNGHANPGHVPTRGWANDAVGISVSSADPQPTA
jgi:hypothetical protein